MLSFKFSYKYPDNSDADLFTSGEADYAGSLLLDAKFGKFAFYLKFGKTFVGRFDDLILTIPEDFFFGYLIGEYHFSEKFRALLQLSLVQSPYRKSKLGAIHETSSEILLGIGYSLNEHFGIELGFTQDLSLMAPEFGLNAGLGIKF